MLSNGENVKPYSDCVTSKIEVTGTSGPGLNVIKHGGDPMYLRDSDSTFISCVDARTAHPVIATPAGDIGEFILAVNAYHDICQVDLDDKAVYDLLSKFVAEHATEYRPFYMHTDDTRILALLKAMGVNAFPKTRPVNADAWFTALLQNKVRYHGCGHVWYQMVDPDAYHISLELLYSVIRAFFELLWDPSTQSKMRYEVVHSAMDGRAVVVVSTELEKNALRGSACKDQAPPFTPRYCPQGCAADSALDYTVSGNGQIPPEYDTFVLHASVAERHRKYVTSSFFSKLKCPKVNKEKLHEKILASIEEKAEVGLEHTLEHLNATSLPVFSIKVSLKKP